jgi:hypothetical protein
MTNKSLPESFVIQQLLETLERIENQVSSALDETTRMTQPGCDKMAYVRASGYSKGVLMNIKTTAEVYREVYANA